MVTNYNAPTLVDWIVGVHGLSSFCKGGICLDEIFEKAGRYRSIFSMVDKPLIFAVEQAKNDIVKKDEGSKGFHCEYEKEDGNLGLQKCSRQAKIEEMTGHMVKTWCPPDLQLLEGKQCQEGGL